ncbi:MAG TPA: trehalose-phosphatase [Gemmatimonadaceae bacterium]|nr:trehalose-phosphatase [Gemmatimonadaceae bacterium]
MSAADVVSAVQRFSRVVGTRLDGAPCVVMLDVDGTLAPIAPTPEQAAVPAETKATLARLVALRDVVLAFVSGRSALDAWHMTAVEGAWVIGNHGFEWRTPDGEVSPNDHARRFEPAIMRAAQELDAALSGIAGVIVENKRWTLSVHYRLVDAARVPAIEERCREAAQRLGLRVTEGKKIVELRPPLDVNKGTAAVSFVARVTARARRAAVLYIGDDRTDEDAFEALRRHHPSAVTVHVAASETATTHAEIVVASTSEVRAVLDWLVERRGR